MKKLLLLMLLACSSGAYAQVHCSQLSEIADDNYTELDALTLFKVSGKSGSRAYFYSAPSKACKNNQVFVIPNDTVVAYYSFNNEGQQWLYAVYTSKKQCEDQWVVAKKCINFCWHNRLG